ncbi:MAG: DUF5615 family PIN-like protein [Cyclobacteriaceae bacterium]
MKFLIDENLPPEIPRLFLERGYYAVHINDLKTSSITKISDDRIRHFSLFKNYVVVTKDDDFVKSYVSRRVPEKVVFIYHSGIKKELIEIVHKHLDKAIELIRASDFVELNEQGARVVW